MLQTVEPLNILTDNLTDVNVEDMEYYILGRHLYQILEDNDIIDDPLERTLIAQNIVNKQREIFMSPLSLRKRILTADFNAETGLKIT